MRKGDAIWCLMMDAGGRLGCHQRPERSFAWRGYQFSVCARCTGILLAVPAALLAFRKRKLHPTVCALLSCVMLADWLVQHAGIRESTNRRRLLTGMIGGFGVYTLHLYLLKWVFDRLTGRQ